MMSQQSLLTSSKHFMKGAHVKSSMPKNSLKALRYLSLPTDSTCVYCRAKLGDKEGLREFLERHPVNSHVKTRNDLALLSHRLQDMQKKVNNLETTTQKVALKINHEKAMLLRINNQQKALVTVSGKAVTDVDNFVYLGNKIS